MYSIYESPVYDLCLIETFFFPDRSLNHRNPGATIPLEQMIPNVSAMAKNMIEDKMIVFSLFL